MIVKQITSEHFHVTLDLDGVTQLKELTAWNISNREETLKKLIENALYKTQKE